MNEIIYGAYLKSLRQKAGLSATQAAASIGVTERMIFHYESNFCKPKFDHLKGMAVAYEVSLDTLMHGSTGHEQED